MSNEKQNRKRRESVKLRDYAPSHRTGGEYGNNAALNTM